MIGTEAVSRAAPDGTTLLMTANTYLIDAQMRKASYHPVTSFETICFLAESPAVLVVNGASPYRTLADLLSGARAAPTTIARIRRATMSVEPAGANGTTMRTGRVG